ncbi:MAG: L-threonine 3-dehydrogenase [Oligoflexales bacterium]
MKALVKKFDRVGLTLEDVEKPICEEDGVLVRVHKTAICGTDHHIFQWDEWARKNIVLGTVVGHEYVGVIEEVGSRVQRLRAGMRVSGEGHIVCGHCRNCRAGQRHFCRETQGVGIQRHGAFAPYLSIPAENVCVLPDDVSDEVASLLDPLGNAVHTTLAFDLVGEDVLITGAGPIGLMSIAVAKAAGARHVVVTDWNEYRLGLAQSMGSSVACKPDEDLFKVMKDLKMTEGFDVGLEMSGHPQGLATQLQMLNHGGKLALLGLLPSGAGIEWDHVIFKGLTLQGIYGRKMYETWYKMISLLQGGLCLDPVITHRFSALDFEKGFQVMNEGISGKVVLDWMNVN